MEQEPTETAEPTETTTAEIVETAKPDEELSLSERIAKKEKEKNGNTNEARAKRIQESRENVRRQAEAHRQQQARVTAFERENAELKSQLAESRAVAGRMQELSKLVQDDPYAAMHQMGISVDNLAKHGTPEGQIAKFQQQFTAELDKIRKEKTDLENQIKSEKQQRVIEAAKQELQRLVQTGEYPGLAAVPFRVVVRDVDELILREHQRTGEWMKFEDALAELETEYQPVAQIPKTETATRAVEDGKPPPRRAVSNSKQSRTSVTTPNLENMTKEQRQNRIQAVLRERINKRKASEAAE